MITEWKNSTSVPKTSTSIISYIPMFHHFSLSNPDLSVPFVTPRIGAPKHPLPVEGPNPLLASLVLQPHGAAEGASPDSAKARPSKSNCFEAKISSFPYFLHMKICYLELNCFFVISQFSSIIWFCIFLLPSGKLT